MASRRNSLSKKFCRCIQSVRRTVKVLKKNTKNRKNPKNPKNPKARDSSLKQLKESGAIAICVKSVLGSRGRTLKQFKCGKNPQLKTQKLLK